MARVWIIEDNMNFRRGLGRALSLPPAAHQVREFTSCEEALTGLKTEPQPEVVLLDVGLPGMDGITGIAHLKSHAPAASILILTVFDDDEKIFRAICNGASGYLLKAQPVATIVTAIADALGGGAPMNPRIAHRVLAMFSKLAPAKKDFGLTERETAVLRCMASGMPRKRIPEAVNLNPHTTDFVIRAIYRKLHVNCATAAVSVAVRERLVEDDKGG
ncbi:MAG: response regulator transcription factor [Verrucomicrobia bacterium]|nr:response regulator transcription factor [Verrucomicrobiota bacterium]